MSRAFVKESDGDAGDDLPERPHSDLPNYITPGGLENLQKQAETLTGQISALRTSETWEDKTELALRQRDLRYLQERIRRAIPVDIQPHYDKAAFGSRVTFEDDQENRFSFAIAGEDETDIQAGIISWASPLARALIGKRPGDSGQWPKAEHSLQIYILAIEPMDV